MDEFADQEAQRQMAKMGLAIYRGLVQDGASPMEAQIVLIAIISGMLQAGLASNAMKEDTGA